jgi:uncharacterized protein (DUF1778 family)
MIGAKVRQDEHDLISHCADSMGLGISSWARMVLLRAAKRQIERQEKREREE